MGSGYLRELERSERKYGVLEFHSHFLRSQWKFREQKELPLSLRYSGEGEVEGPDGGLGEKGLEAKNSEAWLFPPSDTQRENASPAPGTTAEEAMSRGPPPAPEGGSRDEQDGASAETEPWAAAVPPVSVRK